MRKKVYHISGNPALLSFIVFNMQKVIPCLTTLVDVKSWNIFANIYLLDCHFHTIEARFTLFLTKIDIDMGSES